MTNMIQRLFGKKVTAPAPQQRTTELLHGVDYVYPATIRNFLNKDYYNLALEAALQFPQTMVKNYAMQTLVADFILILEEVDQRITAHIWKQKQQLLQTGGVGDVIQQQIELNIAELIKLQEDIREQIQLSAQQKGWILGALSKYEQGYMEGTLRFQQEQKLLSCINMTL